MIVPTAALLVGFDFTVGQDFTRLLGEPPAGEDDRLVGVLDDLAGSGSVPLGRLLAAAWRAAVLAVADGVPVDDARQALAALRIDLPAQQRR